MQSQIRSKASAAVAGFLALCLVAPGGSSWAATAAIYKCLDRNLGLVYTDLPCKDGERLDIRPGDADPAAVGLLEREREELDQSISQRVAEQRRTMLDGEDASLPGYQPEEGGQRLMMVQHTLRATDSCHFRGIIRCTTASPNCSTRSVSRRDRRMQCRGPDCDRLPMPRRSRVCIA